jgi:outer membrane protein OmpA-like peptidoglycan-associated protein
MDAVRYPITRGVRMQVRSICIAAMVMASAAVPAVGQSSGSIELGAFGRRTWFDKSYSLENAIGGGARLGFFLNRSIEVEGDASYNPTEFTFAKTNRVSQWAIHGHLLFTPDLGGGVAFLIGPGVAYNTYSRSGTGHEVGPGGIAGFRFGTGGPVQARVDVTGDYFGSPDKSLTSKSHAWHWGLQAGLSLVSGTHRRAAPTPAAAPAAAPVAPADADQDGVPDTADRCPGTPAGQQVDANGCSASQRDTDKDGVTDDKDKCPDTPAGDKVDANGCTLPKDADNDGVTDDKDKCPNTPAGEQVDANGCAASQRDSDNDGVTDDKDKCPNTAAGAKVDANGCTVLFEENKKGAALILKGVNFETGKSTLLPESQATLNDVAASLKANSEIRVEVQGHTDNTGSAATNRRLSLARANAVRQYLIDQGVDGSRLVAKGYGPTKPIASNKTAEGRAQNRRVQLVRLN